MPNLQKVGQVPPQHFDLSVPRVQKLAKAVSLLNQTHGLECESDKGGKLVLGSPTCKIANPQRTFAGEEASSVTNSSMLIDRRLNGSVDRTPASCGTKQAMLLVTCPESTGNRKDRGRVCRKVSNRLTWNLTKLLTRSTRRRLCSATAMAESPSDMEKPIRIGKPCNWNFGHKWIPNGTPESILNGPC